ncbi:hypothetical protein [Flavobacterium sp. UBA6135]|uniref:hypothetical protein n=1 Tax=Flavobacterium sp. UBA6135 TaxID=1946553 RepID=UPI0025C19EC1|nr:hypothetical protein [Flavobacterium sp. UBA6135]
MMEELDLLKKDWKKSETNFQQKTEGDIYGMLQQKSTSIVKWIFYISLIELSLGILLSLMLSFTKYDKDNVEFIKEIGAYSYYVAISIILYAVVLYFIYKFYSMFKKIAVDDNTKKLMSTILKTRKVVKQYIAFNLSAFAFIFIAAGSYGFYKGYSTGIATNGELTKIPMEVTIFGIIILIVVTAVLTCIFWLIYKLIYGWLLKRLYVNYEELKKIDF